MIQAIQLVFFLVAAANATTPPGRTIIVRVELTDCGATPDDVHVVLDGDEETERPLTFNNADGFWEGRWTDERKRKFPTASLSASLRLKDGRTYCRIAKPEKDKQTDANVARFKFECDEAPIKHVTISIIPKRNVSYVRRLPKLKLPQDDDPDCECLEIGVAKSGYRTVTDVWHPTESLGLQFRNDKANKQSLGLIVLDPSKDATAAGQALFDPFVRENAIRPDQDERCKAGALCLKRGGIETALGQQRALHAPGISPQEYALDHTNLANLELLTLSVK